MFFYLNNSSQYVTLHLLPTYLAFLTSPLEIKSYIIIALTMSDCQLLPLHVDVENDC